MFRVNKCSALVVMIIMMQLDISSTERKLDIRDLSRQHQPQSQPRDESYPLDGVWMNELESVMRVRQLDDGSLFGSYTTKVVATPGITTNLTGRLIGLSNRNLTENPTFGVTVLWPGIYRSTTVWVGQYYNEGGEERLLTTWLLGGTEDNSTDHWRATSISTNQFYRISELEEDST